MHFVLLTIAMSLCSCGHKSSNNNTQIETDTANMDVVEESHGLSHFSDTLRDGKYHQMILEAMANDDKQMFDIVCCGDYSGSEVVIKSK